MSLWLIVAAEEQELQGVLKRALSVKPLEWARARAAHEVTWGEGAGRWWLIATGPGPRLVELVLGDQRPEVRGLVSVGFCGALDPALGIGDIVVSGEPLRRAGRPFISGRALCLDRVAVTAGEKRQLHESTGASVIEMESSAVAAKAREWGLSFRAVRAVSDTAREDMPLDFNRFRDAEGRFSRGAIARAALLRPVRAIPGLLRLAGNCRRASDSLGEFLANCEF